jgi:superfamily II DNA or RNA helicase
MSKQLKYTIKKASISENIVFHEKDIVGASAKDLKYILFTYNLGTDFYSTLDYDPDTGICTVPSGSWNKLDILELEDNRFVGEEQDFSCDIVLKPQQQEIADKLLQPTKLYGGLVQAPCGFGKTYLGSYLIGNYRKPALIICHTKLLAYQWIDVLSKHISGTDIGLIGDGVEKIKPITVGIYKSLLTRLDKIKDKFEVIIVDESHLCVADTFSRVVNGINCKTKIALTATPTRKDGLHVALPDYFSCNYLVAKDTDKIIPHVEVEKTSIPFRVIQPKRDWTKQLTKLSRNEPYLNLIAEKAINKIAYGRCILILSERVEMLEALSSKIPKSVLLVGKTSNDKREEILSGAGTKYNAILSTKIFDEGISCHRLDTLFLTCPNNNPAKLEQRIGRIQREHPEKKYPLIVDFWLQGPIVLRQQMNRLEWYNKQNFIIDKQS